MTQLRIYKLVHRNRAQRGIQSEAGPPLEIPLIEWAASTVYVVLMEGASLKCVEIEITDIR